MDTKFDIFDDNQNNNSISESKNIFEHIDLKKIIFYSYDSIFVTDKFGNVLIANPATAKQMGLSQEELVGSNVTDLIKKGVYNKSTSLEAIEKRTVVTEMVRTRNGLTLMSTSTPLMDEHGEVVMVITNTRNKNVIDKYIEALKQEKSSVARYKTAMEYLGEVNLERKTPVAESPQMRKVIETCNVIGKTDSTVMLIGESGTGKEVIARYIHRTSLRSKEPFIPVNCAAIPHELIESEFFGYVKGAFTGANSNGKLGLFEIADKGTLFLDEIGELPLALQSKLLRVLETGEIQRLGSTTRRQTNVRLITATNRDLKKMINEKLFRSDLYYRLHVIPIYLPPLRERPEDIIVIAHQFLGNLCKKYGFSKALSADAVQQLLNYDWPGNVRELRNVIERSAIISTSDNIEFTNDFLVNNKSLIKSKEGNISPESSQVFKGSLKSLLKKVEEQYIEQVLSECNGRMGEAAKRLGIHRTMLYRKIKQEKE